MKRLFFASSIPAALAFAATAAAAQTSTTPTADIPLESIVAVVGETPITRFDLQEQVLGKIQRGEVQPPVTHADTLKIEHDALEDMIEEELLLQKAKELNIEVADADITPMVDQQIKQTRASFPSEAEFRSALAKSSLGTPEEYRKYLIDQFRRRALHQRVLSKLQQDGKIVPVNVTDAEIAAEFEKAKPFLGPKPASVTFKQIVIAPTATAAAREVARVKAESLLAEVKRDGSFERVAKRESMDLLSKDQGGDLGWMRRGESWSSFPQFEKWLFGTTFQQGLQPGQLSPVFETPYGYHIVRVDRIQTGEVKASQILVMPKIDSADIERTRLLADSVAKLWKAGAPFDSLAKQYHDYAGKEETSLLTPFPRDSLPVTYQNAFAGKNVDDIVTFQIPGAAQHPDIPKFVVAQLLTVDEGGERTLAEMKAAVRSELAQRGGVRRYVDSIRKQTYVSVLLPDADAGAKPHR
jgi:peptidyl-prolyl cis-trans isomerase SurA